MSQTLDEAVREYYDRYEKLDRARQELKSAEAAYERAARDLHDWLHAAAVIRSLPAPE